MTARLMAIVAESERGRVYLAPSPEPEVVAQIAKPAWNARRIVCADGTGAAAYADPVCIYLPLAVSKLSDYNGSLVQWSKARDQAAHVFGRQALPMVWDYAEVNPLAEAAGDFSVSLTGILRTLNVLGIAALGTAVMADA
jgi:adenine-specific DNA methylase